MSFVVCVHCVCVCVFYGMFYVILFLHNILTCNLLCFLPDMRGRGVLFDVCVNCWKKVTHGAESKAEITPFFRRSVIIHAFGV